MPSLQGGIGGYLVGLAGGGLGLGGVGPFTICISFQKRLQKLALLTAAFLLACHHRSPPFVNN